MIGPGTPEAIAHWARIRSNLKPFPAEWSVKKSNLDMIVDLYQLLSEEDKKKLKGMLDDTVARL